LAGLAAQNAALAASLRGLEAKLDQILQATSRAGVHENMLEGGHVFASWTSNGRAGVQEDAVMAPMLLWFERDETKYGSLHWNSDEFCVQSRLRIKVAGQSFPLHSIVDVQLGKTASVFTLPAAEKLAPTLCFTVVSKAYPKGLHLQAHYQEERTLWISQLKQAFLQRRPTSGASTPAAPGTPGGARSLGDSSSGATPGHQRSGSARRASESMASSLAQSASHSRAASHLPSSALAVLAPASSPSAAPVETKSPPTPGSGRFRPDRASSNDTGAAEAGVHPTPRSS